MKNYIRQTTFLASALVWASPAYAQTVDYGTFESLFGEPVTTSATGKPQRVSDVPLNMVIITADQIRRSAARDIPEVLRTVPGLTVQRTSFGSVEVGIRGYNSAFSEKVLVLINGRQVYLDHFGYVAWSTLPITLDEIRQIEVVKGPNTALFGFNAVSGVINIITFDPIFDDRDAVTARVGNHGLIEGNGVVTLNHDDRLALTLSAGGQKSDGYESPLLPFESAMPTDSDRAHIRAEGVYQVSNNTRLSVEYTKSIAEQRDFLANAMAVYGDYDTESYKLAGSHESGIGLTSFHAYRNELQFKAFVNDGPPAFDVVQDVSVVQVSHLFKLGPSHAFRIMGEYRNNDFQVQNLSPTVVTYDIFSTSALWDWTVNGKLSLSVAGRFDSLKLDQKNQLTPANPFTPDDFDQTIDEISINAGAVYKVSAYDTVRLSYGRGIDIPSLIEFGFDQPLGPFAFQGGDPRLDASRMQNVELGYDRRLSGIDGQFRAAVFYEKLSDIQAPPSVIPQFIPPFMRAFFLFQQVGNSEGLGFEAALSGTMSENWEWGLSYSFVDIDDKLNVNQFFVDTPVDFENNNPKHRINGELHYTRGKFEADLFAFYRSDRAQIRQVAPPPMQALAFIPIDDNFKLNARAAYNLTDQVTVSIEALGLNQKNRNESALQAIGREILATISARF